MTKWLLSSAFLIVCSSCESKPVQNEVMVAPAGGGKSVSKATPRGRPQGNTLYSALLEIEDSNSPRPIADQVFGDPFVQGCLRNALLSSGDDFSVIVSGLLSPKGAVTHVKVEHQNDSLRDCLAPAVTNLKLGRGKSGPFKIEISRSRVTPPPGKTYELDLNGPKKFQ